MMLTDLLFMALVQQGSGACARAYRHSEELVKKNWSEQTNERIMPALFVMLLRVFRMALLITKKMHQLRYVRTRMPRRAISMGDSN